MKKPVSFFFDALIVFWAASGVVLAFGSGTLFALIRSAFQRKNPMTLTQPYVQKTKQRLSMIFSHFHIRKK